MLRPAEVLALYDDEMRRDPVPEPGSRVERVGSIVRIVGRENCILFSDLTEANARDAVAEQAEYFRSARADVEWKVFGHDRPAILEAILAGAGFLPDEPETLVVFDLREDLPEGATPNGIEVVRVTDDTGVRDAQVANEVAFGSNEPDTFALYARAARDANQALFVAYAEGNPVASARIEMTPGRAFAGLWGGGTAPAYRHRGIYRALVSARAELARSKGYRFLTVDARATSRPILERLGFLALTSTRAWTLRTASRTAGDLAEGT
ncbi:MAG TPA: GNAT family N-acetyltransferase [Thermoplasmata archaeon]|nr:GNAT family N-acetyltransferase [Thermoplasmata archaeon]